MKRVAIIGGGMAGLATAYYLRRRSCEAGRALEVTVLERDLRAGGKIVTDRSDGFVVEGGPDSFINQKPQGLQLCRDLGLGGDLLPSNDATYKTRLLTDGRLLPYPDGFRLAVPTKIWPFVTSPLISPLGKLRMGFDLFLPRRRDPSDESLSDFIGRRLGREALERIAGPIMSGIFVADPDRMSVQSTFPMFVELERKYGSLTRGIIRARKAMAARLGPNAPAASVFTSLRRGMGSLVDAILAALDGTVRTGVEVASIQREGDAFRILPKTGAAIAADELVLCVPSFEAARLLETIQPELSRRLARIRYVSSATVTLAYPAAAMANCPGGGGYGFVVPRREPSRILALTWASRKFDGRVPEGFHLLRAFVGGSRHEPLALLSDEELLALVREELAQILRITAPPARTWIYHWPKGNPQFDVGHQERVTELEQLTATIPGLHLAGSAYRGLGIPDCTRNGLAVVDAILKGGAV